MLRCCLHSILFLVELPPGLHSQTSLIFVFTAFYDDVYCYMQFIRPQKSFSKISFNFKNAALPSAIPSTCQSTARLTVTFFIFILIASPVDVYRHHLQFLHPQWCIFLIKYNKIQYHIVYLTDFHNSSLPSAIRIYQVTTWITQSTSLIFVFIVFYNIHLPTLLAISSSSVMHLS